MALTRIALIILGTILGFQFNAYGDIKSLIAQPLRPRITDYIRDGLEDQSLTKPLPPNNPIGSSTQRMAPLMRNPKLLAKVIVDFERSFPGATWAFLGRDSAFLCDLVDAYYISIGQYDRVVRLDASGETIRSTDNKGRMLFLMSNGLKPELLENGHPFIMVDATTYQTGDGTRQHRSQSVQLIDAAYEYLNEHKLEARKLAKKLNFINIKPDMYRPYETNNISPQKFLQEQEVVMTKNGPEEILTIDATTMSYGDIDWHGKFSNMIFDNGKAYANPTPGTGDLGVIRSKILWEQYEMLKLVQSEGFKTAILEAASEVGFSFPIKRPLPEKLNRAVPGFSEPTTIDRLLARLKFVYTDMKILDARKYAQTLVENLLKKGKSNPVDFYLKVINAKIVNASDRRPDLPFPKLDKLTSSDLMDSLAVATDNHIEFIRLAGKLGFDSRFYALKALKHTRTPESFLRILSELNIKMTNKDPEMQTLLNHFSSLGPSGHELASLSHFFPLSEMANYELISQKTAADFINKLKSYSLYWTEAELDTLIKYFVKLNPSQTEIDQYLLSMGTNRTEYSMAVISFLRCHTIQDFQHLLEKQSANTNVKISQLAFVDTINKFFEMKPTLLDISNIYGSLPEDSRQAATKLLAYGLPLTHTEDDLYLLLSHPKDRGIELQLEILQNLQSDSSIQSLYALILEKTGHKLENLLRFADRVSLSESLKFNLVHTLVKQTPMNRDEILEATKILYDKKIDKHQEALILAFKNLMASSPKFEDIMTFAKIHPDLYVYNLVKNIISSLIDHVGPTHAERVARIPEILNHFNTHAGWILEDFENKMVPYFDDFNFEEIIHLASQFKIERSSKIIFITKWTRENFKSLDFPTQLKSISLVSSFGNHEVAIDLAKHVLETVPEASSSIESLSKLIEVIPRYDKGLIVGAKSIVSEALRLSKDLTELRQVIKKVKAISYGVDIATALSLILNNEVLTARRPDLLHDRKQLSDFIFQTELSRDATAGLAVHIFSGPMTPEMFVEISLACIHAGVPEKTIRENLNRIQKPTVQFILDLIRTDKFSYFTQTEIINSLLPRLQDPQNISQLKLKNYSVRAIYTNVNLFIAKAKYFFSGSRQQQPASTAIVTCRQALLH